MINRLRTGHPARLHGGVWALVLAFLSIVGLLALGTVTASAAELPGGGNRVRACTPETITAVGVIEHIAAGQGRIRPVLRPGFVVATGVAAEAGASAADHVVLGKSIGLPGVGGQDWWPPSDERLWVAGLGAQGRR